MKPDSVEVLETLTACGRAALEDAREDAYSRLIRNRDEAWEPDQMEPPGEQGLM